MATTKTKNPGRSTAKSNQMTPKAAARIQSSTAKHHGGATPKNSFPTRAQRSADKGTKRQS